MTQCLTSTFHKLSTTHSISLHSPQLCSGKLPASHPRNTFRKGNHKKPGSEFRATIIAQPYCPTILTFPSTKLGLPYISDTTSDHTPPNSSQLIATLCQSDKTQTPTELISAWGVNTKFPPTGWKCYCNINISQKNSKHYNSHCSTN